MDNAATHRTEAETHRRNARESFDRCDTDGFLSQWASGLSAKLADRKADIADNEGKWDFVGLYDGGRRVAARQIENQWGSSWILEDEEAEKYGRRFVPTGARSRVQKKLGLTEQRELDLAEAFMASNGTGLSGSAWVSVRRIGDQWGADAVIDDGE